MTSEQVHSDKDIELFVVAGMAGLGTRPMAAREDFRRWLAEHDAQLIDRLAAELRRSGVTGGGYVDSYEPSHEQWLREQAQARRKRA